MLVFFGNNYLLPFIKYEGYFTLFTIFLILWLIPLYRLNTDFNY